jgi:hypothetical protein
MKTLTLAAAAVLTFGLGVAQAASNDKGMVIAQQTQQPQQVAPGLLGGGGSAKPGQYQSDSETTNPPGLLGGGGSSKPGQYQSGSETTSPPGLLGGGGSAQPNQKQGGNASTK